MKWNKIKWNTDKSKVIKLTQCKCSGSFPKLGGHSTAVSHKLGLGSKATISNFLDKISLIPLTILNLIRVNQFQSLKFLEVCQSKVHTNTSSDDKVLL